MFHRFPSLLDDPQMTGGTRITKEVVSLVKLIEAENFFGNEIGPAAEIPSLPRKNSKLKKTGATYFFLHASRILKINTQHSYLLISPELFLKLQK